MSNPGRTRVVRIVLVALCCLAIPIVPFVLVGELPGDRWLDARGGNALAMGAAGAGLLALDLVLPIPSSIVGTLLGARLGWVVGFAWTMLGLQLGQTLGFAGARLVARREIAPLSSSSSSSPTAVVVFLSRPVPVLAEAVTFAAGVTGMKTGTFAVASVAGNALYAAALCLSGATWLPRGWAGPGLIVPMLLPAAGWWIWRRARSARRT